MYIEKYKKYKKKYLELLQRGGVIDNKLSDSELVVLSWNILNSDIEINKFTFSFYSNKFAEEISKVDNTRFFNFRKDIIIVIIDNLLEFYNNKIIICLQEVNKIILSELIKKFYNRVIFTEDKIDQRVIIFGDKIKFIHKNELFTDLSITNNRTCLFTIFEYNSKMIKIFNLHLPFSSNECDYNYYAENIKLFLPDDMPFLLCGDFNACFDNKLYYNFLDILGIKINKRINTNTIKNISINIDEKRIHELREFPKFTSININKNFIDASLFGALTIIDHIFGNLDILNFNIINNLIINDIIYEIFYNTDDIIENLFSINYYDKDASNNKIINISGCLTDNYNINYEHNMYKKIEKSNQHSLILENGNSFEENLSKILEQWLRLNKDISDHLPIIVKIKI